MKNYLIRSAFTAIAVVAGLTSAASAEVFLEPKIQGRYIDACLESHRFQNGCNNAARGEIAQQFCRRKGFSSGTKWQTLDFGWDNRTTNWKWKEVWVDGNLRANFYSNEGANRFTVIECR
ncbi:hypothetical protein [Argonema galeatum]|uniref:hypothetical protein n=1 Tax=Argonema galeatum TaxID=2942762 RepID=UPI002010E85A|nr:hypothetical protein [Argonema galeatum]MCL1467126.1 hypothetical protein [Argonema galeatum A003/A1]